MEIPALDAQSLFNASHSGYEASLIQMRNAAEDVGFLTLSNTQISATTVRQVLGTYRQFFAQPDNVKRNYDMANTGSNRGWGAPGAEQVDPASNPDFKEVFDSGLPLEADDPLSSQTYYAPNLWPVEPVNFRSVISSYYSEATQVSLNVLSAIAQSLDLSNSYFADKFDKPMTLLRGNYYPPRPDQASAKDFGIAPHTDYGCLTLLATDGSPGLEVQSREGRWIPVSVEPGSFVINFGEMLQMWTNGRVIATPHRVIGGSKERLSIPLFFNPRFDVNVASWGSRKKILAGEHLAKRYDQTYVHRQTNGM